MWDSALSARDLALQAKSAQGSHLGSRAWPETVGDTQQQQYLDLATPTLLHQHLHAEDSIDPELRIPGLSGPQEEGEGAVWINPSPFFVIKSKLKSGKKLFLNVCGHQRIEPWHYKELLTPEAGGEGSRGSNTEQRGIRVPMSIGPCTHAADKRDVEALCCDVVLNEGKKHTKIQVTDGLLTDTLKRCWRDPEARGILSQFACAAVAKKHQLTLQEAVSFPKSKYKGTLPPPPQRIRVTREARIEPLGQAETESGARAPGASEGAQEDSLADHVAWDGCFAAPPDAEAFCAALMGGLVFWQNGETGKASVQLQAQPTDMASRNWSPWMSEWAGSSHCSSRSVIPVGCVDTTAQSPTASPVGKDERRGLRRAFLVASKAAAASSSQAEMQDNTVSGRRKEARSSYSSTPLPPLHDSQASLQLQRRSPGLGIQVPLRGCSLSFPIGLCSSGAIALVCTYSCCEDARRMLQQQKGLSWETDPTEGSQQGMPEGIQSIPASTQHAAFLLTEPPHTRLHVELYDSDSDEDCSDLDKNSSSTDAAVEGSSSIRSQRVSAAASLQGEKRTKAAFSSEAVNSSDVAEPPLHLAGDAAASRSPLCPKGAPVVGPCGESGVSESIEALLPPWKEIEADTDIF
ncbi:hypothetical protein cyc_08327 [Cyclospora cayetanensis]|uniref:PIH1 N-terminal domain-containing protein n=1 Tax=Cyclospora cayetanensis TaxID=88456 RepID=A0A1D3D1H4_9EIME|nr:hypothetical protein cyc_08327 [Cyclospora cayetanensis]